MRKFLVFLSSVMLSGTIAAQPRDVSKPQTKRVDCFDPKTLLNTLRQEYGEFPIARGLNLYGEKSQLIITVNSESGSFTVMELRKNSACVLSSGEKLEFLPETDYPQEIPTDRSVKKVTS